MSDEEDIRVTFGDAPGNSLPLVTVEKLLREWHKSDPETMGWYTAKALFGAPPRRPSKRRES